MDQGLVSPTLLGNATEADSLIDSAFLFEVLHDYYLWIKEQMRLLLGFMADDVGDVMYYHQAMNQPDAWNLPKHLSRKSMGMWIIEIGS